MHLLTQQQTPAWQQAILAGATQANELSDLVWFVQMIVPLTKAQRRTQAPAQQQAHRYRTACWPGAWVPYLPVAPDPMRSRIDAELLAGLFVAANPATATFAPALGLRSELATVQHYEFGQPWDLVCSRCGAVFGSTVPTALRLCAGCEYRLYRMAMQ
jgi:hypothetical protein